MADPRFYQRSGPFTLSAISANAGVSFWDFRDMARDSLNIRLSLGSGHSAHVR
jgi:hypothetical protein